MDDLQRLRQEYARREQYYAGRDTYTHFDPANLFTLQQRQRQLVRMLHQSGLHPLGERRILDCGCGYGGVLLELLSYGAQAQHLHGVDLLDERLRRAHSQLGHLALLCADGQALPYPDGTFDLVLQFTVLSSILDPQIRQAVANEMLRMLQPHGAVLWYDFWLNPTNPQARGIRPAQVRQLFPGCQVSLRRITLAPPIARRLVPLSWTAAALLEKLRLFNSHYLGLIRPARST